MNDIKLTHTEIERIAGITNNFQNVKEFAICDNYDSTKPKCKWLIFDESTTLTNIFEIQD